MGEFETFWRALTARAGKTENEHVVTLYAIYLKNGRAEKLNGNGYNRKPKSDPNAPATEKQKNAIAAFARRGKIAEVDVESLIKREASKILDEAFGKGEGFPFLFFFIAGALRDRRRPS